MTLIRSLADIGSGIDAIEIGSSEKMEKEIQ